MLFNSVEFAVFAVLFYNLYLHLRAHVRWQNALLLVGSYVFYGWWDWRFLSLLALSTVIDFTVGRRIAASADPIRRRRWLRVSVVANLSILGFFKYFGFFTDSAIEALGALGLTADPITLDIVLPVGISFYTFQTLSYSIDVYRGRMAPTDSLLDFAVFVAFFPQLVAGPIERAQTFLPQIAAPRRVTARLVESGLFLIAWGLFKKIVIADNAAAIANPIFDGYADHHGVDLLIGALAFTVQIYGDFSGYSDIARGLARTMGFELMVNFRIPYISRSPSEFWRRWHISLSSWLRDYLYIGLGGNRGGALRTYRNLALTMLLGGLWHGAAWNFVLWGAFHGAILILYRLGEHRLGPVDRAGPVGGFVAWLVFFALTVVGWILFRAQSIDQIGHFLTAMWAPTTSAQTVEWAIRLGLLWAPLVAVQALQLARGDLLAYARGPLPVRALTMAAMVCAMLLFGADSDLEFIYFQF